MKQKIQNNAIDAEALELILCKISSCVCETERLNDSFLELKKRYAKALRELSIANETNALLKREIKNLRCREASLMGQLRKNTEDFGDEEVYQRMVN